MFEQFVSLLTMIYGDAEPNGQPASALTQNDEIVAQLRAAAERASAPIRLSSEHSLRYLMSILKLLSQSVATFLEPRLGIDMLN